MATKREFSFLLAAGLVLLFLASFSHAAQIEITTGTQSATVTPAPSAVATLSPDDANVAIHVNYMGPLPVPSPIVENGGPAVTTRTASSTTGYFTLFTNGAFDEFYLLLALLLLIAAGLFFAAKSNYESFTRVIKRYLAPGGEYADTTEALAPASRHADERPELG
jgi:uncharacterized protein (UPF0333 family)